MIGCVITKKRIAITGAVIAVAVLPIALAIPAIASPTAAAPAAPGTSSALTWQPCGGTAVKGTECTSVTVPLDWAHPQGAKISVALARLRAAKPARRIGSLLVNLGGPGDPGAQLVENGATVIPQQLHDEFDLIGFDPRGVGQSRPAITCTRPVFDPKVPLFPTTKAQYDQLVAHNREVGEDCLRQTGPLLGHVDTASVAHDLEATRVALGENRLNFFALSYAGLIGNIYAHFYPTHVRAFVLDSPVDHTTRPADLVADENTASDAVLHHFFTWCDQTVGCDLHAEGAAKTYDQLLGMAAKGPLPATGYPDGVSGDQVQLGVYKLLQAGDFGKPILATLIKKAVTGDASALANQAATSPKEADNAKAYVSIACQDVPSDIHSFEQLRQREDGYRRAAPRIGAHVEAWLVMTGCIGWPVPAADPQRPEPVHGAPPILIASGMFDPAAPLPYGIAMHRQISRSILLTRSPDGHGGVVNDPCTRQREIDYLTTPSAPVSPCP
jgi:pimeloyl-ACP methyl ester carboxylesterase